MYKVFIFDNEIDKLDDYSFLIPFLPEKRRKKYENIKNEKYKKESLLGYLLLVIIIKEIKGFYYFPDYDLINKPYDSNLGFYFNISHSNNIVGICISDSDVGFDLECVRNISDKVVKRLKGNIDSDVSRTMLWTKYESICKLTGKGISQIFDVEIDDYDVVSNYNEGKDYCYSIAFYK